jgi:transposase
MATEVTPQRVGVDVSKVELMVSVQGQTTYPITNDKAGINAWLKAFHGPLEIAMEATNDYHLTLALLAHAQGHQVFLLNGYQLKHYREGIGQRAKTDATDAALLARYLEKERADLRPWEPPSKAYRELQILLHRRATLVQAKTRLQQSFQGISALKACLNNLIKQMQQMDLLIQKQIRQVLHEANWQEDVQRCQAIEGVGPITAAALTMAYHRAPFRHSDAFIAFLGMDVRVRDSGAKRGRRTLTKRGDPELRRLLYLAAMQAKRRAAWQEYYQRCIDRGLAPIQALNALARKLARVAFAIIRNQTMYQPKIS